MPSQVSKRRVCVIKLSGSLFFSSAFHSTLDAVAEAGLETSTDLVLIAGGGSVAREYISAEKSFGSVQTSMDEVGIAISRVNAMTTIACLNGAVFPKVPTGLGEIVEALEIARKEPRIVVCGGLHPGQSTNAVGALVSEKIRASLFVNSTDVEGVFDKDPKDHPDAVMLPNVTVEDLERILGGESAQAGGYDLMDHVALQIVKRSKIPTRLAKCDARVLSDILTGRGLHGTEITF